MHDINQLNFEQGLKLMLYMTAHQFNEILYDVNVITKMPLEFSIEELKIIIC
jgi:hypothetical protein